MRTKLLLLAAPFLKRWNYARHAEQISGGHKYLPPRQDVNAPGEERWRVGFLGVQCSCWMAESLWSTRTAEGGCLLRVLHSASLAAVLVAAAARRPANRCRTPVPLLPSDLYIPVMALWTYCLLLGVAALARSGPTGGFKPETIYNSVRAGCFHCCARWKDRWE